MKKFNHLTDEDIDTGKDLNKVIENLDEVSKKTVLIYASGLRDRQMISEENKIAQPIWTRLGKEKAKMEIKLKVKINESYEIEEIIKKIKEIEKEYSCICTLLEIETN